MIIKIYEVDNADPVAEITLPERQLSPFWEEARETGRVLLYEPLVRDEEDEDGRIVLVTENGGRGARCDGCAQDECGREWKISPITGEEIWYCPFCCFRSTNGENYFTLPSGSDLRYI